jgi:hypothetical protein
MIQKSCYDVKYLFHKKLSQWRFPMDCGTYWNTFIFFFAKLNSYFAELQCLNFQKEWSVRCALTVISIKDAVIDKYVVIFFLHLF